MEYTLETQEREVLIQHFLGEHSLFLDHTLEWRAGYADTTNSTPDRRSYIYENELLTFSTIERRWSDLEEESFDFGVDYSIPWDISANWSSKFDFGVLVNSKDRENETVRIGYRQRDNELDRSPDPETIFQAENFESGAIVLTAPTDDTDAYSATQDTSAVYLSTEFEFNGNRHFYRRD